MKMRLGIDFQYEEALVLVFGIALHYLLIRFGQYLRNIRQTI